VIFDDIFDEIVFPLGKIGRLCQFGDGLPTGYRFIPDGGKYGVSGIFLIFVGPVMRPGLLRFAGIRP